MRKSLSIPKLVFFAIILLMILLAVVQSRFFSTSHAQAAMDESRIRYLSVPIVAKDTLSDIALEYYSDEFGSMDQYISRIKEYNSLTSDAIYAGNYLIIPVYAHSDDVS
ncbi:MAG: LysM peptidoglycan-binding domain-containing protein [Lachnospiraceae bacterium]|nr:LysM peptidoglycan-binding domain-containing protein [Lachnospiraceae bacterium]